MTEAKQLIERAIHQILTEKHGPGAVTPSPAQRPLPGGGRCTLRPSRRDQRCQVRGTRGRGPDAGVRPPGAATASLGPRSRPP